MKYGKKEYEEALAIVEAYERQQSEEMYGYENLCEWKASQEIYEDDMRFYGMSDREIMDYFMEDFFA